MTNFLIGIWIYTVIGYWVAFYHSRTFIKMAEDDPEMMEGVKAQMEFKGPRMYWLSFYTYFMTLWPILLPLILIINIVCKFRPPDSEE